MRVRVSLYVPLIAVRISRSEYGSEKVGYDAGKRISVRVHLDCPLCENLDHCEHFPRKLG